MRSRQPPPSAASPSRLPVVVAALTAGTATTVLLRQMQADLQRYGRLRAGTAAAMYAGYAAHAASSAAAWTRTDPNLPARSARAVGAFLVAAGGLLCVAGMRRFASPGQVSGTTDGPLVTTGVYRLSRNPQYTGYLLLLAGAATTRRSLAALGLAGVLAAAYRAWIPAEEHHLRRVFGADYNRYRRHTPRWLALNPRRCSRTGEPARPGRT